MVSLKRTFLCFICISTLLFSFFGGKLYADPEIPSDESSSTFANVISLHANVKDLLTWLRTDSYSETLKEKDLISNLMRLRLSPELNLSDALTIHVDLDNELITGNYLKSSEFNLYWINPYDEYNDFLHTTRKIKYTDAYYYRAKIHRAYAKATLGDFTFSAGRQQFRFGSGRLWNPLDILNPINPISFEGAAEQKGADGASLEYFINEKTVVTAVVGQNRTNNSFGESFTKSNTNAIGRFKTNISIAEIAFLAGTLPEREACGGDISLILFGGTLRGSALFTREKEIKNTVIASGGFEYNFSRGLYFLLEYFYNSASLNAEPKLFYAYGSYLAYGFDDATFRILSNRFLTYNRHYAAIALGYDITPLLRVEFFTICDYEARYILLNPSVKYNLLQDIDLSIAIMNAWKTEDTSRSSELAFVEKHPLVYAMCTWFFL